MSFPGQNQTPDDNNQMTFDNADMPPPPGSGDDDEGGGIVQFLKDSYNGVYKVVLEPSMPTKQTIILLCVGLLFGLIWGYSLRPVEFADAAPRRLTENAQEQWIRMVAVGSTAQVRYTPDNAAALLEVIPNPQEKIDALLSSEGLPATDRQALQNLRGIIQAQPVTGAEPVTAPGLLASLLSILIPFVVIIILTPILVLIWRLLFYPNVVAGAIDRFRQMTDAEYREQREREKADQQTAREQAEFRRKMREESVADAELGEPVMQNLSIFDPNRNYDDSFEIELPLDQGGDFLGQCGAALAAATQPEPVAIELWLFDMFSQQNLKKIFVTEQAWNDPSIRSRLEDDGDIQNPETDIQIARDGASLVVDSDKLRLQGTLQDLKISPDGRFEEFKMPVTAWQKEESGGAPPVPQSSGSPSMSEYDDIEFDPPPQAPSGSSDYGQTLGSMMGQGGNPQQTDQDDMPPPPSSGSGQSSGGGQRLEPPPLNMPPGFEQSGGQQSSQSDDDDDDPFGGTGDFTPLPNR